jgi:hypothetical protein
MSEQINKKYLKYKNKYLLLNKHMIGGVDPPSIAIADLPYDVYSTMFKFFDLRGLNKLKEVNKEYSKLVDDYMGTYFIRDKTYLNNLNDVFILCKIPRYHHAIIQKNNETNEVIETIRDKIRIAIDKMEYMNKINGGPFSLVEIFENQKPMYKIILKVHNIEIIQTIHRLSGKRTYNTIISNVGGFSNRGYMADLSTEEVIGNRLISSDETNIQDIHSDGLFSFLEKNMFKAGTINTLPLLLEKIDNITLEIHEHLIVTKTNGMHDFASSSIMIHKII